jgi:hypothetical protein
MRTLGRKHSTYPDGGLRSWAIIRGWRGAGLRATTRSFSPKTSITATSGSTQPGTPTALRKITGRSCQRSDEPRSRVGFVSS